MLNSNLIKSLWFFGFTNFSQKAYAHLVEHQCSAENSLGNDAVINNENSTPDVTNHTTNNFPVWKPIIVQLENPVWRVSQRNPVSFRIFIVTFSPWRGMWISPWSTPQTHPFQLTTHKTSYSFMVSILSNWNMTE